VKYRFPFYSIYMYASIYHYFFLCICRAGEWSEVEIPLNRFLMTWRGKVLEQQVEMHPGRITGLGISLAGGDDLQPEGPYSLGIEWIAARNHAVIVGNED
jgi:Complex I intermediate-associated protein 30 (CIA30)